MNRINITCDTCSLVHDVPRTPEIPSHVVSMGCNWCPACEDRAEDYYEEWYNESDGEETKPDDVPNNQLCMPFVLDEILREDEKREKVESR